MGDNGVGNGAEAYPYDRRARVETLVGLDKLRAVEDRALAAQLYALHQHVREAESDARVNAELRRDQEERERAEVNWMRRVVARVLRGDFGEQLKDEVESVADAGTSPPLLRQAMSLIQTRRAQQGWPAPYRGGEERRG